LEFEREWRESRISPNAVRKQEFSTAIVIAARLTGGGQYKLLTSLVWLNRAGCTGSSIEAIDKV
jgi:hypothetical protein